MKYLYLLVGLIATISFCINYSIIPSEPKNLSLDDIDCIELSFNFNTQSTLWNDNGIMIGNYFTVVLSPQLISDGLGGAIVTWQESGYSGICAQRVNSAGFMHWSEEVEISITSKYVSEPQITSDGSGGAIIAWLEWNNPFIDSRIILQKLNSTGHVQWDYNGIVVCAVSGEHGSHKLVSDGNGGAIIVWKDERNGFWNQDIYGQRVDSSGVPQWTTDGTPICNAVDIQWQPQLIADGSGGAIVVWADNRSGDSNIYAQQINKNGETQWTPNGTVISNTIGLDQYPQIVSDGFGGAIMSWTDGRSFVSDIYAQRISQDGITQWTANGTIVCNATGWQEKPQMINDDFNGAIVVWEDRRNGLNNFDIFAQRINSTGNLMWENEGQAVCTSVEDQDYPQLTTDDDGGAIIVWHDNRSGSEDIYAQGINSTGHIQWDSNGSAICSTFDQQRNPQIIKDGFKGAIIVWEDFRNNKDKGYIQRIIHNDLLTNNDVPQVNHPKDITTNLIGKETIRWILTDTSGSGYYQIKINQSSEGSSWIFPWRSWENNSVLNIEINRIPGEFSYTIDYYDNYGIMGPSDEVLVKVNSMDHSIPGFNLTITLPIVVISLLSISIILIKKRRFRKN